VLETGSGLFSPELAQRVGTEPDSDRRNPSHHGVRGPSCPADSVSARRVSSNRRGFLAGSSVRARSARRSVWPVSRCRGSPKNGV